MSAAISVFFLGGTISMSGNGAGVVSRLGGHELIAAVPQLAELPVAIEVRDFRRLPSACLGFADIAELVAAAGQADPDGVVVVQGTDTIEETSYLIDLLWPHPAPIVVTGAMRNPALAGPDGPANLLAAVQVAASPRFRDLGALVVLNDEVHAARYVRKLHTTSPATFGSPNAGPVGLLVEGVPVPLMRPARFIVPPSTDRQQGVRPLGARVALYVASLDDDGALLAEVAANYAGLVVAGVGAGHVPAALAEPLGALAAQLPVVLASRAGAGPVLTHTYGAPGSEIDLLGRGLLGAGLLDAYKARVLLRVLLSDGADRAAIADAFARASGIG
jgi:L-asparaginase/Glu-tRNA(Gln) amidotransferase subunit D